ncbi:MAG: 3-methyl-2-oxobutanoate hydroxymethyltransferase [Gaiellaceae bacterium]
MTVARPILANSCALAATAEEARFRIDRPIGGRAALVIALDDEAAEVVDRVAELPWQGARFFRTPGELDLDRELTDTDVAIMIATADADGAVAERIARACAERGIMTSGLILGERLDVAPAVSALRPYARNLMVTDDEDDVGAVLTALRA